MEKFYISAEKPRSVSFSDQTEKAPIEYSVQWKSVNIYFSELKNNTE